MDETPQASEGGLNPEPTAPGGMAGMLLKGSFITGSAALLAAMSTDFVAVICRHLHVSFIGAIEIIQACVVLAISASVIAVTLTGGHAAVHLVTERLSPRWQGRLARISYGLGFLAFGALAAGEAWLYYDTHDWDERSDLLGLPIWPLRLIWTVSLSVAAVLFLLRTLRGAPAKEARP